MKKEVKLFNDDINIKLTDIPNLKFLDFIEEGVEVKPNTVEMNGTDGLLIGPNSFGPFNLILNFSFKGYDSTDLRLIKQKLRGLLFRREPYYVWHSDLPGKKYAVYCTEDGNESLTNSFATFAITFVVFKGYSESLRDTNDIELLQENVQFEQGLDLADKLKYKHSEKSFSIFNGSTDIIDPLKRHKLIIQMSVESPNGFKIRNKTTGDVFEYKKKIKKTQKFILNGVYPYVDKKRVGIDTNYSYLTLATGINNIVIEGDGVEQVDIEFIFNYIYR
ncbi:phage tail protein [Staphylococcus xylosus]|uniref:phage tail domain-containing protein n=1 Tax=Staphylococcus xylosus TaxID=1288 RepID=UPI000D1F5F74|nr:phage tail domain-containing protein [Staphylococcus xylosus]PTI10691.1 phage tail protein [Staphylococcus xylosus]